MEGWRRQVLVGVCGLVSSLAGLRTIAAGVLAGFWLGGIAVGRVIAFCLDEIVGGQSLQWKGRGAGCEAEG